MFEVELISWTAPKREVWEMGAGEVLEVRATDPSTERDIPKFCQFLGHTLLEHRQQGDLFLYWIEKKRP